MEKFKLTGIVLFNNNEPVQEASVFIEESTYSHSDIAALTNENGGFSLLNLLPGKYSIAAFKAGFQKKTIQVDIERNINIKFFLKKEL